MDNITYIYFCRVLFIVAALFILFQIFLYILEKVISRKMQSEIYRDLHNLLDGFIVNYEHIDDKPISKEHKKQIARLMYTEAQNQYKFRVIGNDYLMNHIFSLQDLLVKFFVVQKMIITICNK